MTARFFAPVFCLAAAVSFSGAANAAGFFFSTGSPDGLMASASRPTGPSFEIETGDDFVVTSPTTLTGGSFTGLLPANANLSSISSVTVEIYRVFPNDSDVTRTSGPPTFSTVNVPTRVNSPSDVELVDRSSAAGSLSFTPVIVNPNFTAANSVTPGGIHAKPFQTTTGNGPQSGQEVIFALSFITPLTLGPDHYFFVPQVQLSNGDFLWLSAPRPIGAGGTPFPPGFTDLQGWARDAGIDPDWLRVGTDIVGGATPPTFNFAFTLQGDPATPLPAALPLFATGLGVIGFVAYRRKRRS